MDTDVGSLSDMARPSAMPVPIHRGPQKWRKGRLFYLLICTLCVCDEASNQVKQQDKLKDEIPFWCWFFLSKACNGVWKECVSNITPGLWSCAIRDLKKGLEKVTSIRDLKRDFNKGLENGLEKGTWKRTWKGDLKRGLEIETWKGDLKKGLEQKIVLL